MKNSQKLNKHISYSEFKIWSECGWRHKLAYLDKISSFSGNEYTAFGTAIHETCEKVLFGFDATSPKEYFSSALDKELSSLEEGYDTKFAEEMRGQGTQLLPHVRTEIDKYFGDYEVIATEEMLYEDMILHNIKFKGYIDMVLKTKDGKYHIIDWKTCSWGWNFKKKTNPLINYQLTLYKKFFAEKHGIDPKNIETYFVLLKRTAKKDNVEVLRITSGQKKTSNALKLLENFIYNVKNSRPFKNRLSCRYCDFYKTEHCR